MVIDNNYFYLKYAIIWIALFGPCLNSLWKQSKHCKYCLNNDIDIDYCECFKGACTDFIDEFSIDDKQCDTCSKLVS